MVAEGSAGRGGVARGGVYLHCDKVSPSDGGGEQD